MRSALPAAVRERLAAARTDSPAWREYVDLLEAVLEEDASGKWDAIDVAAEGATEGAIGVEGSAAPLASAPALEGTTVFVPETAAQAFVARILGKRAASVLPPLALLEAAVRQDSAALAALARSAGVAAEGLEALAGLCASPMLRAAARRLASRVPASWGHGHCPVCGAWPALGELRGLERERHLRCGRCAADWRFPWLRCAHCGASDEKVLSQLVLEDDPGGRRVETCGACHGYVKSISTLSALSPADLALADLTTVDLDLAAQARGRRPPPKPAVGLRLRVARKSARGDGGRRA